MSRLMGPVLSFRGVTTEEPSAGGDGDPRRRWHISALVVTDDGDPGLLAWHDREGDHQAEPEALWSIGGRTAHRYGFDTLLHPSEASRVSYRVLGQEHVVHLPAGGRPPRMAYASCNGFSSVKEMKRIPDAHVMWKVMAAQHRSAPYHLLLQGGDQVYADALWETVPTMREWGELGSGAAAEADFTAQMETELCDFYFGLYTKRWAQPDMAKLLASVPTVAMWDDHDILDGWGSYPPQRQGSRVFEGLWPIARKAFATFQQHVADSKDHPTAIAPEFGFSFGHVVGGVVILALDMRSERTDRRVLSDQHWDAVYDWLETHCRGQQHLLVMSSIPVVYPGFDTLETLLGAVPGQQDLEDDLRDHWNSRHHKGERLRLIHRLLRLSEETGVRPTLISGDVHVAELGLIESVRGPTRGDGSVINQLISSGVVHPSPPGAVLFALRHLLDSTDEVDRGIVARMTEFPGTQSRFVGGRNFLSLEPDDRDRGPVRIWAKWLVEDDPEPYVKVIHPVPSLRARSAASGDRGLPASPSG